MAFLTESRIDRSDAFQNILIPATWMMPLNGNLPAEVSTAPPSGIAVYRFPEWFTAQYPMKGPQGQRTRPLVHRRNLMPLSRENGSLVVATGDPFELQFSRLMRAQRWPCCQCEVTSAPDLLRWTC